MTLRIGIDARAAAEVPAGKGRYVRELLRALAGRDDPHEYLLYTRRPWEEPLDERFSWHARELPEAVWHLQAARAANRGCNVFLATTSYVTPWFLRIPAGVVVHDLIAFRTDVAANRRAALIERATLRRALRRSALVVCDSHATCRDLLERFPWVEAKAAVVQLAAGEQFARARDPATLDEVRSRHRLARPFVLSAGTLEPRKNLVRVLEAFARLPERLRAAYQLVVVGPRGWEFDEILASAQALGDDVRLLGHVSDDDLAVLYQACEVFCYPSLYEGFGLPLLEAMSMGAPSIASNVSSLPEVGGDGAIYVNPASVEEITSAVADLLDSPEERARLRERGRRRAEGFSWERTAGELLRALTALR
jgi:glycosyltransferase involved in cell wall biosynthesis